MAVVFERRENAQGATGVDGCARGLVPGVSTTTVLAPTRFAMAFAIPTVAITMPVVLPGVMGRDVHHRPADWRRWNINWRWCAIHRRSGHNHSWRTDRRGRGYHYRRVINGRAAERDADGEIGAGLWSERSSHPDDSDYDQCFSFHSCKVGRNVQGELQGAGKLDSFFFMKDLARKGGSNE